MLPETEERRFSRLMRGKRSKEKIRRPRWRRAVKRERERECKENRNERDERTKEQRDKVEGECKVRTIIIKGERVRGKLNEILG